MAIMSRCIPLVPSKEMTVDEFKAWIARFDLDHDGSISREELQRALQSLHTWFAWWKARKGIKQVDTNRNRRIDTTSEEMDKLVAYAQEHLHMKIYEDGW
ncbi:hypothetical protein FRX31_010688 [Thalictrum thalictroides]|uniref:EF-hand domain-containing protein n=1 Tax=Thalictrum thalictroides TaxID=46969 RepID=A0A7J6WSA9_THATH|nr:hypothetical protein FRX31_010688 [Thalictrum thalictroides]